MSKAADAIKAWRHFATEAKAAEARLADELARFEAEGGRPVSPELIHRALELRR